MRPENDPRNIANGFTIPCEHYCDQPYAVVLEDGAWVVTLTTGGGKEGAGGQHIISSVSRDKGKTWSKPVDIEPANGPAASWVMPFLTTYGRIYAFYVYNKEKLKQVKYGDGGYCDRVDTLGAYCYKYSDDGGESWSEKRYEIPLRAFDIDDANPYGGKVKFFWGVGKPIRLINGGMMFGFAKVGKFSDEGFMETDEGAFLRCDNIDTERDPEKLVFETLPEGKKGLRAPKGKVADEHNPLCLSDGTLMCSFRTVTGHNCTSFSHDGGRTWETPRYMEKEPGGRLFKHPRAANFLRRYTNGRYSLWFHNHGKDMTHNPGGAYVGRNPAWLCGGVEKDGRIYWSEPEIVLYSRNASELISYPDFIEQDGHYYITETQKSVARVHEVDINLMHILFHYDELRNVPTDGLLFEDIRPTEKSSPFGAKIDLSSGDGFCMLFGAEIDRARPRILLDGTDGDGRGIRVAQTENGELAVSLYDGNTAYSFISDQIPDGLRHLAVNLDGAAGILSFNADGAFLDGGEARDYGFGYIDKALCDITGAGYFVCGGIRFLRVYGRFLYNNEIAGCCRADKENGLT